MSKKIEITVAKSLWPRISAVNAQQGIDNCAAVYGPWFMSPGSWLKLLVDVRC